MYYNTFYNISYEYMFITLYERLIGMKRRYSRNNKNSIYKNESFTKQRKLKESAKISNFSLSEMIDTIKNGITFDTSDDEIDELIEDAVSEQTVFLNDCYSVLVALQIDYIDSGCSTIHELTQYELFDRLNDVKSEFYDYREELGQIDGQLRFDDEDDDLDIPLF